MHELTIVGMSIRPPPDPVADVASPGLACCRCRYDLRGLSCRGKCPECGELVEISAARAANPPKRPRARMAIALALGLGSLLPFLLLLTGQLAADGLWLLSPVLSIPGLCVAIASRRHWHNGTAAERAMLAFGALFSLAGIALFAVLIYLVTHMPMC